MSRAAPGHDDLATSVRDGAAVPLAGTAAGTHALRGASQPRSRVVDHAGRRGGRLLRPAGGNHPWRSPRRSHLIGRAATPSPGALLPATASPARLIRASFA